MTIGCITRAVCDTDFYISHQLILCTDDPKVFANAPISIQVVGRTLEEEAVLAMTELVDAAVKDYLSKTN